MKCFLSIFIFLLYSCLSYGQNITTIGGNGSAIHSGDNGPATSAGIIQPRAVAVDDLGNIYVGDLYDHCVRKISAIGIITTIVGIPGSFGYNGDNIPAVNAKLHDPFGIAVDKKRNIYIADAANHRIRKIDTAGIITTIGGTGTGGYNGDSISATSAQLKYPLGVATDSLGNVYVSDAHNYRIRKIDTFGFIYTIAGTGSSGSNGDNGPATAANVYPNGIVLDGMNVVYFSDSNMVRKISASGIITTIAGNGTLSSTGDGGVATAATLSCEGIALGSGGIIYLTDYSHNRIRRIDNWGIINTIAGTGFCGALGDNGPATAASVCAATGVAVDTAGNIYVADLANQRVRKIYQHTVGVSLTFLSTIESISIHPNPTNGKFMLKVSSEQEWVCISVVDRLGREIKRVNSTAAKQISITIDAPDGVYFVKINTPSGTETKQIIINH